MPIVSLVKCFDSGKEKDFGMEKDKRTHTQTQTYTLTHTHAHTHTHTHRRTHMHTHSRTQFITTVCVHVTGSQTGGGS